MNLDVIFEATTKRFLAKPPPSTRGYIHAKLLGVESISAHSSVDYNPSYVTDAQFSQHRAHPFFLLRESSPLTFASRSTFDYNFRFIEKLRKMESAQTNYIR